jgi:hypothetical protein
MEGDVLIVADGSVGNIVRDAVTLSASWSEIHQVHTVEKAREMVEQNSLTYVVAIIDRAYAGEAPALAREIKLKNQKTRVLFLANWWEDPEYIHLEREAEFADADGVFGKTAEDIFFRLTSGFSGILLGAS